MVPMNASDDELVGWLVEGDPSIRWRVHQDLIGSSATMVRAEGAKVSTESWGAKLIALQDPDGVAEPMAGCAPYQGPLANLCRIPRPYLVPDREQPGLSRWNTMRALRVVNWWEAAG